MDSSLLFFYIDFNVCSFKGQLGLDVESNKDVLRPTEVLDFRGKRVLMLGAGSNHSFAVVVMAA